MKNITLYGSRCAIASVTEDGRKVTFIKENINGKIRYYMTYIDKMSNDKLYKNFHNINLDDISYELYSTRFDELSYWEIQHVMKEYVKRVKDNKLKKWV